MKVVLIIALVLTLIQVYTARTEFRSRAVSEISHEEASRLAITQANQRCSIGQAQLFSAWRSSSYTVLKKDPRCILPGEERCQYRPEIMYEAEASFVCR